MVARVSSCRKQKSAALSRIFGPSPLLYGEDEAAYEEMLARVTDALAPKDILEEIWVHDLVNAAWNFIRFRRIQAAFLNDKIWKEVNDEATSIAEADPKLMEGTEKEKEEMQKLLDHDSESSWEERMEQYPRANEKFQKRWRVAESALNKDLIEAKVINWNANTIERIEQFIAIAQRRYDAIIRELDRHRLIQDQRNSVRNVVDAEFKTLKGTTVPKIAN